MKAEYVNPFIESVHGLFTVMLNAKAYRSDVGVVRGSGDPCDLMALIGFGGLARGMVALAFPTETALNIVERLLGTREGEINDTVRDAIAEVVNIVAGGAKAKIDIGDNPPIDLSLPTIVRGSDFIIDYPTKSVWLEVPFTTDLGPFKMRITFELDMKGKQS